MRTEKAVIPKNIKLDFSSNILRMAATAIDPFPVIFSFLDFKSIVSFYKSILKTHGQLAATRKLTLQNIIKAVPRTPVSIALQEKLIRQGRFFQALDDDLIRTVLLSPYSPNALKLKVLLENIISQHGEIPEKLSKKLFQHIHLLLKSAEPQTLPYFLVYFSYLKRHHKILVVSEVLKKSRCNNQNPMYKNWEFILGVLSGMFPYLSSKGKKNCLDIMLSRLYDSTNAYYRIDALQVLSNIFPYLSSEDRKNCFARICNRPWRRDYGFIEKAALTTLGAVFPYLSSEDQEICLSKINAARNAFCEFADDDSLGALGAIFPYLSPENKETYLTARFHQLSYYSGPFYNVSGLKGLGDALFYLSPEDQKSPFKAILRRLDYSDYCCRFNAARILGNEFPHLSRENQKIGMEKILEKFGDPEQNVNENPLNALIAILPYLSSEDQKINFDKISRAILEKLMASESCTRISGLEELAALFLYISPENLSPENQKIYLGEILEKLNDSDESVPKFALEALDKIQLDCIRDPALRDLFSTNATFKYPALKSSINTTSTIMGFTIPNIELTLSQNDFLRISRHAENMYQKKQEKINEVLLSINIIFYEHFIKPDDINLNELKAQFENLIKTVQQKRFSIGLFSRAPGDTHSAAQLIGYFKTPQSLKARKLLQETFGEAVFSKNSVNDIKEFEASLKKLMAGLLFSGPNSAATEKAPIQSLQF